MNENDRRKIIKESDFWPSIKEVEDRLLQMENKKLKAENIVLARKIKFLEIEIIELQDEIEGLK